MGHRGQRVPDWQLDPLKRRLVQSVLKQLPRGIDTWDIYHALLRSYEALGTRPAVEAVNPTNLHLAARLVAAQCMQASEPVVTTEFPEQVRQSVQRLVREAVAADAAEVTPGD
jgi:hypothetical protein